MTWKNSSAVVQTPGVEPNQGRMYLAMIGWTWNRRNALRKTVSPRRKIEPRVLTEGAGPKGPGASGEVKGVQGRGGAAARV